MLLQTKENEVNESVPVYFRRSIRFLSHADDCWYIDVCMRVLMIFMIYAIIMHETSIVFTTHSRFWATVNESGMRIEVSEAILPWMRRVQGQRDHFFLQKTSIVTVFTWGGVLRSTPSVTRTSLSSSSASTVDESYPQDRTKTQRENTAENGSTRRSRRRRRRTRRKEELQLRKSSPLLLPIILSLLFVCRPVKE